MCVVCRHCLINSKLAWHSGKLIIFLYLWLYFKKLRVSSDLVYVFSGQSFAAE